MVFGGNGQTTERTARQDYGQREVISVTQAETLLADLAAMFLTNSPQPVASDPGRQRGGVGRSTSEC